jgi:hypothetical protein
VTLGMSDFGHECECECGCACELVFEREIECVSTCKSKRDEKFRA